MKLTFNDFYFVLEILQLVAFPIFLITLFIIAFAVFRTGKIGKFDLNTAFQRRYEINASQNASVFLGSDLPLNSDGKVDQKEFAKRTWALTQQYHSQGLHQSRISFWFSIFSAGIGFIVILYGASLAIGRDSLNTPDSLSEPIFVIVCGAIIDAVAALFFVQSNKAQLLMSDFFDRLRVDRKLEESLSLIKDIENKDIAARTQALLAINLAEIKLEGALYDRIIIGRGFEERTDTIADTL